MSDDKTKVNLLRPTKTVYVHFGHSSWAEWNVQELHELMELWERQGYKIVPSGALASGSAYEKIEKMEGVSE